MALNDVSDLTWIDHETAACEFPDERLTKRCCHLLEQLGQAIGQGIPTACQNWASTKAAYRFFSNSRVSEVAILSGHREATKARALATTDKILIAHDSTSYAYSRGEVNQIGMSEPYTAAEIHAHNAFVMTPDGVPLGIIGVKFWTRELFEGADTLEKELELTRISPDDKESARWLDLLEQSTSFIGQPGRCVHIGDRESDMYEFFCVAKEQDTHFLIRTNTDRLAGDGTRTVFEVMAKEKVKARYSIEVKDKRGNVGEATIEIKFKKMIIHPPTNKKKLPPIEVTVIHATEVGTPKNRDAIHWELVTDLPVRSRHDVFQMIRWYALRWKIEVFHKTMKSYGCNVERSKLQTSERLVNFIALFYIIGWRIFWLAMLNREHPNASPEIALTASEIEILDLIVPDKKEPKRRTVSHYIIKIARLGGYLARANDRPPGNLVVSRGLTRLAAMVCAVTALLQLFGADLISQICG